VGVQRFVLDRPPDDGKSGGDPIREELPTNCPEPDQRHQPYPSESFFGNAGVGQRVRLQTCAW
jgi:hypothetical protein